MPFIPHRDISVYCFEELSKASDPESISSLVYSFRVSAIGNFNAEGISSSKKNFGFFMSRVSHL